MVPSESGLQILGPKNVRKISRLLLFLCGLRTHLKMWTRNPFIGCLTSFQSTTDPTTRFIPAILDERKF